MVAVAVEEGVQVHEAGDVRAEGDLEEHVADDASRASGSAISDAVPATIASLTGPAAEIAIRRRRGSNQASEVST